MVAPFNPESYGINAIQDKSLKMSKNPQLGSRYKADAFDDDLCNDFSREEYNLDGDEDIGIG